MERHVVIGVAEVGDDGDDLAVALEFRRGDRGADPGVILFAQTHHQLPDAPPPPNDPPPPEKPPKPPPPPPQPPPPPPHPPPPRLPRLRASRPHRMTATSPLSSPRRR